MRVTLTMLTDRIRANLMNNSVRLLEAQERAASGKRVRRPSDDVAAAGRAISLRAAIASIDQYDRNSTVVETQLSITTGALGSVVSKLQDVRSLAIRGASAALSTEARLGIATELDLIYAELAAVADTQSLGRYIFSGSKSDVGPLSATGGDPPYTYQGNTDAFSVQVAPGTFLAANVTGDAVFNLGGAAIPGKADVFATIQTLKEHVLAGDVTAISADLANIDANLGNVTAIRSLVGARLNRLESTNEVLLDSKIQLMDLLSKTEDADLADAVLELRTRENVYQAAIATANRVLEMSLSGFLR